MNELDSINAMLMYVGLPPIASLIDCDTILPAAQALIALNHANNTAQARGWIFNTDQQITLALAVDEIPLPANALGITNNPTLTKRGMRLYDTENNTYKFTQAQTIDLISLVNFDDLPMLAQVYVLSIATREFSMSQTGSASADQLLNRRVQEAATELVRMEMDAEPVAILISPSKATLDPNNMRG